MTTVPLSQRLRTETKEAHTTAERSGIMRDLLRGTIAIPAYVALQQNLAALYDAMESEIDRNDTHPALRNVNWNAVRRLAALQSDIKLLTASDSSSETSAHHDSLVPATRQYVAHLHDLGTRAPELLFAHAYLRYLGDMYGGQIIKRILLETVLPPNSRAVAFYEFDQIPDLHAFMVPFRGSLDSAALSEDTANQMVSEAQLGYALHARMFEELAAP
ncbi:MAG: biliverdin-producing heme oxygenase [Gemmatimonas sp.]